jgi:hypothetical protein
MANDQLDLSGLLRGQLTLTPEEHPDVLKNRLKAESRAAFLEDCKGVVAFIVVLLAMTFVGILATYEGFFDIAASADTKRWSQTVLSSIVAGSVSFVLGRKVGK